MKFNLRFSAEAGDISSYRSYLVTCKQDVDVQEIMSRLFEKIHSAVVELDMELSPVEEKQGDVVGSPVPWADVSRENPS